MEKIVLVLAGLMGAAGIVLASLGAHVVPGAGLESASAMLLFHACAATTAVLAVRAALLWLPLGMAAAFGFVIGAGLLADDISLRALAGHRLFAFAAPAGGTILILSWLAFAAAALFQRR
jgi:uncharacterized membrane protein YgdD (TMEM256/DUF423 family)